MADAGDAADATLPSSARPPDDVEARRIAAAARAALFGEAEPVRVGRFTVLGRLGAGAMGVVYAAWDPQLDRKVALKLVRAGGPAGGRERLLGEARAAARLAHPAVVTVFDSGVHGDDVWIAMEHIAGVTLREWLARPRPWTQIVEVARQCGAGLAAAHDADVLHRDFKPDNVLVATRGAPRAWVVDFGLAVAAGAAARSGSGTPAYMAPEQHTGGPITAAADQFAFAVTFLEALDGHHPFGGDPAAVVRGHMREPAARPAPAWVRAVLVRAAALEPGARHPSMHLLLAALARDPRRRWRRAAAALGLVLLGGGTAALALGAGRAPAEVDPCAAAAASMDAIWPARRGEVAGALAAIERPWAATSGDGAVAALDRWAAAWRERRIEACRATHVTRTRSAALLDLRAACLDRVASAGEAMISLLAHADVTAGERARAQIEELPRPAVCDDDDALRRLVPLPDQPGAAAAVEDLGRRLAAARAAIGLGQGDGDPGALIALAAELGWAPQIAEAEYVAALTAEARGDHPAAMTRAEAALTAALGARDDRQAAEAAAKLVWVAGYLMRDAASADRWDRLAGALVTAAGDARLAAILTDHRGVRAALRGELDAAERHHRDALAAMIAATGADHPATVLPRINLGVVLVRLGRLDDAAAELEAAAAQARAIHGPLHPILGPILTNLGVIEWRRRNLDAARRAFEEGLAIKEAAVGRDHPSLATTLGNLAGVMGEQGELRASLPLLARAVAVLAARDPEHPGLIDPMINQVLALIDLRERSAVATADRLVAIASRDGGPAAPAAWYPRVLAGWARLVTGDAAGAIRALEPLRALPGRETASTGELVDLDIALSQAYLARGDRARARALAISGRRRLVVAETPAARVAEIDAHLRALGID